MGNVCVTQVAQQHLVEVADGRIEVRLCLWELAQVVGSGVLLEELALVGLLLQSEPGSLERAGCDTSRGSRHPAMDVLLAALHRDKAERAVEAIYLLRCLLLAERKEQLAHAIVSLCGACRTFPLITSKRRPAR